MRLGTLISIPFLDHFSRTNADDSYGYLWFLAQQAGTKAPNWLELKPSRSKREPTHSTEKSNTISSPKLVDRISQAKKRLQRRSERRGALMTRLGKLQKPRAKRGRESEKEAEEEEEEEKSAHVLVSCIVPLYRRPILCLMGEP